MFPFFLKKILHFDVWYDRRTEYNKSAVGNSPTFQTTLRGPSDCWVFSNNNYQKAWATSSSFWCNLAIVRDNSAITGPRNVVWNFVEFWTIALKRLGQHYHLFDAIFGIYQKTRQSFRPLNVVPAIVEFSEIFRLKRLGQHDDHPFDAIFLLFRQLENRWDHVSYVVWNFVEFSEQ